MAEIDATFLKSLKSHVQAITKGAYRVTRDDVGALVGIEVWPDVAKPGNRLLVRIDGYGITFTIDGADDWLSPVLDERADDG